MPRRGQAGRGALQGAGARRASACRRCASPATRSTSASSTAGSTRRRRRSGARRGCWRRGCPTRSRISTSPRSRAGCRRRRSTVKRSDLEGQVERPNAGAASWETARMRGRLADAARRRSGSRDDYPTGRLGADPGADRADLRRQRRLQAAAHRAVPRQREGEPGALVHRRWSASRCSACSTIPARQQKGRCRRCTATRRATMPAGTRSWCG